MVLLLDFRVDEVAVLGQFTDQRIHLTQCQLWPAFQKTTNETVPINAKSERGGTGLLDSRVERCNKPPPLRRNHPDARSARHIGNNGTAPAAAAVRMVFLRRTWPPPAVWWFHGCGYRPSGIPNCPDSPALLRGFRNAVLSAAFSGHDPHRFRLFPYDRDLERDRAWPPRRNAPARP